MSSLSQIIQALAQGRQHNRMLRLSFPHGDGPATILLANRLEAEEGLSRDFEYTVEVLAFQGKQATISLVRGDGRLRHLNGYDLIRSNWTSRPGRPARRTGNTATQPIYS